MSKQKMADLERRLEEAQRRIQGLEDFFGAHDDEEALLKNELFEAQHQTVAQQARIEQLRDYACSCNTMHGELLFPCRVHDRPELDDLSALTAHDAELTAKAKAEALAEAKLKFVDAEYFFPRDLAYLSKRLDEWASEYRAKATEAGRKE